MMLPKPSAEERTMTAQIKSHPIISKLIDAFGNWRKHRQEIREIRDLDDDEFATLANELRITPADLDTFVRQGPHAVDELPKLLTDLGITAPSGEVVRSCPCRKQHPHSPARLTSSQAAGHSFDNSPLTFRQIGSFTSRMGCDMHQPTKSVTRLSRRGVPHQVLERQVPRIPDNLLDCVVYLYPSEAAAEDGERTGGSGFLVGVHIPFEQPPKGFLICVVTNKHVIDGGSMVVRINTHVGLHDIIALDGRHWFLH